MPNNLLTPIVNDRTRSVNFFNGRLLTGEDLTAEQQANRVAHSLLGQAVGSGVAYGLEVAESATLSQTASPVLSIKRGLAINPNGGALLLDNDTDISLVRPASPTTAGSSVFAECLPMQSGVYIAGAGVYLLTVGPASETQGLAEVSGVSTATAPCNSKYKADGVQFRLVQLDLTQTELGDVNHLRNLVAYKCFGVADWAADVADPFGMHSGGHGLIDQLRAAKTISGCEVPLAVLYWTATDGVVFVDMWSVRRRLTRCSSSPAVFSLVSDRAKSDGLAMLLQFSEHMRALDQAGSLAGLVAQDVFRWLPPAGLLSLQAPGLAGVGLTQFFGTRPLRQVQFLEGSQLEAVFGAALAYGAIDLSQPETIWLYTTRENTQAVKAGMASQPFVAFANARMPLAGIPRFDLSRVDYSNYVACGCVF
jgi:hypothetical protein